MTQARAMLATAALMLTAIAVAPPSADACGNGVEHRVDPLVKAVSLAEALSANGDQRSAMATLVGAAADLRTRKLGAGSASKLTNKALRVAARAIVRSDGKVGLTAGAKGSTRDDDLAWATSVMRGVAAQSASDPQAMADLGEALERSPKTRREARRLLEPLEQGNTLASAYGYAALARIKAAPTEDAPSWLAAPLVSLDQGTRAVDLARCKRMTKTPSICGASTDVEPGSG
jgi:hypothetical protein